MKTISKKEPTKETKNNLHKESSTKASAETKKPSPKTDADLLVESKDRLLRLQAEFANFQKRTIEENSQAYSRGVEESLKKFVTVFDDFQMALNNASSDDSFKKGMELIFAKLVSGSEDLGLQKIKSVGEKFDPKLHEALLVEESNKHSQVILEELQSGYLLSERVIRTAKVKVSK